MIKTVYHFADLHIRCGENDSRFDDYEHCFEQLAHFFQDKDSSSSIVVVCGDIFHIKGKTDVYAIKLLDIFIKSFRNDLQIFIIRGNHDLEANLPSKPDLLEILLQKYNNVTYFKKTTYFKYKNIGLGIVDVLDTLEKGTTSGKQVECLPEFPHPSATNVDCNIALFHGTLKNCILQNYHTATEGFPIEWLQNYDIALLGDIHQRQINKSKKHGLTWAYPGSLVQQNFGEDIINHGFFEWDILAREATEHNIKAKRGFLKLKAINDNIEIMNSYNLSIHDLIEHQFCPDHLNIRLFGNINVQTINNFKGAMELFGKSFELDIMNDHSLHQKNTGFVEKASIVNFNTKENWIAHIENDIDIKAIDANWKQLINEPENLKILPSDLFSSFVHEKIEKKNKELVQELDQTASQSSINFNPTIFKINSMEWSYILCFGKSNHINFNDINSYTTLISGLNAVGKTSFLECILIAFFGEGSPAKNNSVQSAALIHNRKPKNEKAFTTIEFQLNDKIYKLHRSFRTDKDGMKIKESEVKLFSQYLENTLSGNRTVNDWLKRNLCNITEFLQTCMVTQTESKDFFHLSAPEQLLKIEVAQNMASVNSFNASLEVSKKNHNFTINLLQDLVENELSETSAYDGEKLVEDQKQIDLVTAEIDKLNCEVKPLYEQTKKFNEEDLSLSVDDIEGKICELKKTIDSNPHVKTKDELLIEKGKYGNIEFRLKDIHVELDVNKSKQALRELEDLQIERNSIQKGMNQLLEQRTEMHEQINNINSQLRQLNVAEGYDINEQLKIKKKIEQLLPSRHVIEANISKLETFFLSHENAQRCVTELEEGMKQLETKLSHINSRNLPFNPNCAACLKQPWKIEQTDLQYQLNETKSSLKNNSELLDRMNSEIEIKSERLRKNKAQLELIINNPMDDLLDSIEKINSHENASKVKLDLENKLLSISTNIKNKQVSLTEINSRITDSEVFIKDHEFVVKHAEDIDSFSKLRTIDKEISDFEAVQWNLDQLSYWESVLNTKKSYDIVIKKRSEIACLQNSFENLSTDIQKMEQLKAKFGTIQKKNEYINDLKSKIDTIDSISKSFKSFRHLIFNEGLLPFVCNKVNDLVNTISSNRSILSGQLVTRQTKVRSVEEIEWKINFDGCSLPIEKCSGYQRSIYAFAMLICLNSINTKLKNMQLFIDEGFVSYDEKHLSKVFDLLDSFKSNYNQIILVSHLDELKRNAQKCIDIDRASSAGESFIRYGKEPINNDFEKKRGRPKKTYDL